MSFFGTSFYHSNSLFLNYITVSMFTLFYHFIYLFLNFISLFQNGVRHTLWDHMWFTKVDIPNLNPRAKIKSLWSLNPSKMYIVEKEISRIIKKDPDNTATYEALLLHVQGIKKRHVEQQRTLYLKKFSESQCLFVVFI